MVSYYTENLNLQMAFVPRQFAINKFIHSLYQTLVA